MSLALKYSLSSVLRQRYVDFMQQGICPVGQGFDPKFGLTVLRSTCYGRAYKKSLEVEVWNNEWHKIKVGYWNFAYVVSFTSSVIVYVKNDLSNLKFIY